MKQKETLPRVSSSHNQIENLNNSFTSKSFLNPKQRECFLKTFERFSKKSDLHSKLLEPLKQKEDDKQQWYQWQLAVTQEKDSDPCVVDQVKQCVLNVNGFLVLIEGVNAGQKCVSGVFSSKAMMEKKIVDEIGEAHSIPKSSGNFMFYYQNDFEMHFEVPLEGSQQLGSLMLSDKTGIGLQFQYYETERIFLSYQQDQPSVIDIDLQEMIPIDEDKQNFPKDIPASFELTKVEYWVLKPAVPLSTSLSSETVQKTHSLQLLSSLHNNLIFQTHNASNIGNYQRGVPVYSIPEFLDVEKVVSMINVSGYRLSEKGKKSLSLKLRKNRDITIENKMKVRELGQYGMSEEGVIDVEFDAFELYSNCTEMLPKEDEGKIEFLPVMPIFDAFQAQGGVQQIIDVIQTSLKNWKNTERAQRWELYMKELKSFSFLPNFFGLFMKNKDCVELLFELLAGLPDEIPAVQPQDDKTKKPGQTTISPAGINANIIAGTNTSINSLQPPPTSSILQPTTTTGNNSKLNPAGTKKWDEEEAKAVNYSYQVLKDTFKLEQDNNVRLAALENSLIEAILDRVAIVSKEVKRKLLPPSTTQPHDEADISDDLTSTTPLLTKQPSEDDGKKKIVIKKGIGYGSDNTGQNQKWNTSDYVQTKKARSESLQNLIAILEAFLDFKDWEPPRQLMDQLLQSALLPLIEGSLRSGSLLEMSKDKELVFTYLSLIRMMAKHRCLVPCLLPLEENYEPKQIESILELTQQLKDTAKIFLNCMSIKTDAIVSQQQQEEASHSRRLAEEILLTYEIVSKACKQYEDVHEEDEQSHNAQDIINTVLKLPLPQKYKLLLQDLRFDYTSFKNQAGKYQHHYLSSSTALYSPPQSKMVRLAQELADLSTALPIDHTNSIFVRCDSERADVMKCMVMGAKGTPYAHGAYIFDVYFGDDYPNGPPKCNLETTGGGKVRFNPNLYACGKVCLSLLGTWRGNASENWDPKISTLLQILVSLQAIIMSEEVYFNEPGFEGEAGTEEGEKKNEAYSNIVRYCNIKYAMIDQIKNQPDGFKTIIQRHFYLKKEEILEECQKWIKYADVRQASYIGLVNDHNNHWCTEFKTKYPQMLREAVAELEQILNKIPPPTAADTKLKIKGLKKRIMKGEKKKTVEFDITQGVAKIDDIDVKYDDEDQTEEAKLMETDSSLIDINDEKVKDRWSRYIGAMGIDAVAKQSKCSVFLSGIGSLGVEISKNLVMSGLKRLTIHDSKNTSYIDLAGQFYLGEEDLGKNRAEQSLKKIKQLNHYVKVDSVYLGKELPDSEEGLIEHLKLQDYNIVVLTEVSSMEKQILINEFCRKKGIKFISADTYGPWCRLFNDFGDSFEVIDKNGENPTEVMIKNISCCERGIVTLLTGTKHPFEDGEHIVFSEVQDMESIQIVESEENKEKKELMMMSSLPSINGSIHKIRVINSNSFEIGDTRGYLSYIRNGVAKNIKTPVSLSFKNLSSVWNTKSLEEVCLDENLRIHDFEKCDNPSTLFIAFRVLDIFQRNHNGSLPSCWNATHTEEFMVIADSEIAKLCKKPPSMGVYEVLVRFALTVGSNVGPMAAFLGGFATQEIVKAITQKYIPTMQLFFTDCMEIIPSSSDLSAQSYHGYIKDNYEQLFKPENNRDDGIRFAVGNELLKEIHFTNLFMVGCGAIGCELLKNFAMINLATGTDTVSSKKGVITITDPDHIEISNLNRQFLFREKHLRKPKSQTAAATIIQMNPLLKDHILARLEKVSDATVEIFSDKFFNSLTLVANALDNVQARRYVDSRCVTNRKPLLESGTLGPKGHVQVILPFKTESYGSQQDPQEEGEIPHCTLKMFPEETLHCIEWARDKFGKLFTLRPKSVVKILEDDNYEPQGGQEMKEFKEAIKLLEKRPNNFDDCVVYAVKKFSKYYVNDIKQLMYTYPLDSKTKDGEPFWKLPKRPPTEIYFDAQNALHRNFVTALAVLRAKIFRIPYPKDFRTESMKEKIAQQASLVKVEEFKASQEKANSISSEVKKDAKHKTEDDTEADIEDHKSSILDESAERALLFQKLQEFKKIIPQGKEHFLQAEEFEKDEDDNGHIDLIYAMANCRSLTYKLAPMDWIQVKLKAGRIVPALATTTATVAGLQTIELIKILKQEKLSNMKNAFLNLAVPLIQLTEPQAAEKINISKNLHVTLWDRWEISLGDAVTLRQIFKHFLDKYELHVCDIMTGSKLIYSSTLMNMTGKEEEKEATLDMKLLDLLDSDDCEYVEFIFTFTNLSDEKIKQTPLVRVYFR